MSILPVYCQSAGSAFDPSMMEYLSKRLKTITCGITRIKEKHVRSAIEGNDVNVQVCHHFQHHNRFSTFFHACMCLTMPIGCRAHDAART